MAILSDALKKVLNYRGGWFNRKIVYSGFYISNEQLIELGENLKTYNGNNHPDGVCFMVGKTPEKYTVEIIPYKRNKDDKEFYKNGNNVGLIQMALLPEYTGAEQFFINIAGGGGGTAQRTPPPGSA
jgi:hypothetical protein